MRLGDDVLVHLRGAARDRERPAVDAIARPGSVERVGAEHVARDLGDVLLGLAPQQLGDAALGAHGAAVQLGRDARARR